MEMMSKWRDIGRPLSGVKREKGRVGRPFQLTYHVVMTSDFLRNPAKVTNSWTGLCGIRREGRSQNTSSNINDVDGWWC